MNLSAILSIVCLLATFGIIFGMNYDFTTNKAKADANVFNAPYYFVSGEFISYINAYLFVFVFSLLFFGLSAPIAFIIEGGKYASLLVHNQIVPFDFVFLLPELLVAYSAILLGRGVLDDFEGKTLFESWNASIKFFGISFGLLVLMFLIRMFMVK
jgi:hypothetical protein